MHWQSLPHAWPEGQPPCWPIAVPSHAAAALHWASQMFVSSLWHISVHLSLVLIFGVEQFAGAVASTVVPAFTELQKASAVQPAAKAELLQISSLSLAVHVALHVSWKYGCSAVLQAVLSVLGATSLQAG